MSCHLCNISRICYVAEYGTCRCVGDPHCMSLDGKRYTLQDACDFRMFKTPHGIYPSIEIDVTFARQGRNQVRSHMFIFRHG